MKKFIKIGLGVFLAVALLVVVIVIGKVGGAQIAEGTYKIKECKDYPDAYISVEENKVQFHNIDLNAIYQEEQMKSYMSMVESGATSSITDEQLKEISDLNSLFVSNPYELDYESIGDESKSGTFTYIYFCYNSNSPFGLVLEYNSFDKTIQINSPVLNLIFEK